MISVKNLFSYIFSIIILGIYFATETKILLFTYACNNPHCIVWQAKSLEKFLLDDYEFIVFNNAFDEQESEKIEQTCKALNIKCCRIPLEIHKKQHYLMEGYFGAASVFHCRAAQWSLEHFGLKHNDIVVLLDGDLFLIKPFSFRSFLKNYDLASYFKYGGDPLVPYPWIGLLAANMKKIPDKKSFNICCTRVPGGHLDSGGAMYLYLKKHSKVKLHEIKRQEFKSLRCEVCQNTLFTKCMHNTEALLDLKFDDATIQCIQNMPLLPFLNIEFFLDCTFFHIQGSSGYHKWQSEEEQNAWYEKNKVVGDYFKKILELN